MERAVVVERGKLLLAFTESTYSMDTIGRAGDLVGRLGTVAEREAMAAKLTPLVGVLSEKDFLKIVEELIQKTPEAPLIWPERRRPE